MACCLPSGVRATLGPLRSQERGLKDGVYIQLHCGCGVDSVGLQRDSQSGQIGTGEVLSKGGPLGVVEEWEAVSQSLWEA